MAEHTFSMWVALQCLNRLEPLKIMVEHASGVWVALQCLSRSELLTRAEHNPACESLWTTNETCVQLVGPLSVFEQIRTTDKKGWTCVKSVGPSSISRDQNHWDQNHWQEWLNTCPHVQLVSHSHVWASKLLTRTAEHVSKMWVLSRSVQLFSKIYDRISYAVNRVETLMWKCMKFEGQGKKRETLVCWSYCGQIFNF